MEVKIRLGIAAMVSLLACNVGECASDAFSAVRCESDVRKALLGRLIPNERVVIIEERHKDLELKDLGGTGISDHLFLTTWRICGDEYAILVEKDGIVKDVLKFPVHSKRNPQFIGTCRLRGEEVSDEVIGVFERSGKEDMLPVRFAWRINVKQAKFIKLEIDGLLCLHRG